MITFTGEYDLTFFVKESEIKISDKECTACLCDLNKGSKEKFGVKWCLDCHKKLFEMVDFNSIFTYTDGCQYLISWEKIVDNMYLLELNFWLVGPNEDYIKSIFRNRLDRQGYEILHEKQMLMDDEIWIIRKN